jgi:hypothetical protein
VLEHILRAYGGWSVLDLWHVTGVAGGLQCDSCCGAKEEKEEEETWQWDWDTNGCWNAGARLRSVPLQLVFGGLMIGYITQVR